jgi:hypothetical protein
MVNQNTTKTLDQRIEEDLKDLYNGGASNGEIKAATASRRLTSEILTIA